MKFSLLRSEKKDLRSIELMPLHPVEQLGLFDHFIAVRQLISLTTHVINYSLLGAKKGGGGL